jgi:hypothetical protein
MMKTGPSRKLSKKELLSLQRDFVKPNEEEAGKIGIAKIIGLLNNP